MSTGREPCQRKDCYLARVYLAWAYRELINTEGRGEGFFRTLCNIADVIEGEAHLRDIAGLGTADANIVPGS